MAELMKFDLEHVMPMHRSGQNFVDLAGKEVPDPALRSPTCPATRTGSPLPIAGLSPSTASA
jgi:hypothetical protein